MKPALAILSACLVVSFLASGVLFSEALQSKRKLRLAEQKMAANLQAAQSDADTVSAEKQEMTRKLQVFQELTENLQSQVTDLTRGEAAADSKPPVVAPYQAQAYLGKTPIGWVWIIPHNLRMDTNAQRYVYEPIVWLDEGFRKQFVTHHTNIVEREVETQNYVNTAYYPEPYLYGYNYPSYPTHPIHRPPGNTNRPPVSTWPPATIQPVAQQPFNPGSGAITVQKLGTPAGAIKTRAVP